MSSRWFSEISAHHDSFKPVIRIGNAEVSEAMLEEMLEVAEFIRFLRAKDPSWEQLWTVFKTIKRLEK